MFIFKRENSEVLGFANSFVEIFLMFLILKWIKGVPKEKKTVKLLPKFLRHCIGISHMKI